MTQASRPQADNLTNFPAPSDPGPYSADQWAELFRVLYTGDQPTTQGPLVRYLNELEVTDNGSTEVYVDTGAGMVNGHFLVSSEKETWTVPAGPAGGRTDRVVMVENNSNAEVTQSTAGRPLLFSNDLSEYTATPGVPAYSARLAILRGDDLGNLPALDWINTLYMVELARYDINNVPAISAQVDHRDFCEFSTEVVPAMIADRTRKFFVPAVGGYNVTDGLEIDWNTVGNMGVVMVDTKHTKTFGQFMVPQDFVSGMTVTSVVIPAANGNCRCAVTIDYGQCAENYTIHTDTDAESNVAVTISDHNCIKELAMANAAIGDLVHVMFERRADLAGDTVNDSVLMPGWIVSYTADS